jgi:hypothetical protein
MPCCCVHTSTGRECDDKEDSVTHRRCLDGALYELLLALVVILLLIDERDLDDEREPRARERPS